MLQLGRNFLKHVSRHSSAPKQTPAFGVTDTPTVEFLCLASKLPQKICFSSGQSFCFPFSEREPVTLALSRPGAPGSILSSLAQVGDFAIKWFLLIAGRIGLAIFLMQLLLSIGAHAALGAEPPKAKPQSEIVLDQQLIDQLHLFEKEIARSQYTEFCATVTMPPPGVIEQVEEASRAGDEHAQVLFMWVFRLIERYKENGCGDA